MIRCDFSEFSDRLAFLSDYPEIKDDAEQNKIELFEVVREAFLSIFNFFKNEDSQLKERKPFY